MTGLVVINPDVLVARFIGGAGVRPVIVADGAVVAGAARVQHGPALLACLLAMAAEDRIHTLLDAAAGEFLEPRARECSAAQQGDKGDTPLAAPKSAGIGGHVDEGSTRPSVGTP